MLGKLIRRVSAAARQTLRAARNVLEWLLTRERSHKRVQLQRGVAPVGGEPRRVFMRLDDAEAYAAEIPVPTVVVVRPPDAVEADVLFGVDDTEAAERDLDVYEVYIVYGDNSDV